MVSIVDSAILDYNGKEFLHDCDICGKWIIPSDSLLSIEF
jgi:hypothetical protein